MPAAAPVTIDPVPRGGLGAFVALPRRILGDDPAFVAPLAFEERRQLDPRANPHFRDAEIAFWIARRGQRCVGRISAQVDRVALAHGDGVTGAFGHFDVEDDPEAARTLLATAEGWLRAKGMRRVMGPFEVSVNDRCGLLVEGFDTPPMLMMGHARPHYAERLEAEGYVKARDLLAYRTPVEPSLPPQGVRLVERLAGANVRVRPIAWKRYREEIDTIMGIFNDAWGRNWGFVPLTDARLDHMARSLKTILIEDLVAVAEVDGEPAGMMVALPNVNEAIRDLDGRLLPLGWAKLLWRLKVGRLGTLRVPLMGVRRKFHGRLTGGALMVAMFDRIRAAAYARGMREAELSWVLEDNRPMRHIAEHMGARVYKRYRIYEKGL